MMSVVSLSQGVITPCVRAPGEVVPGPKPRPLGSVMPLPGEALCCLTGEEEPAPTNTTCVGPTN